LKVKFIENFPATGFSMLISSKPDSYICQPVLCFHLHETDQNIRLTIRGGNAIYILQSIQFPMI